MKKKENIVIKSSLDNNKNNFEVFNFEKLIEKMMKNSQKILKNMRNKHFTIYKIFWEYVWR